MRRDGWCALVLLGAGGLFALGHVAASYWDYGAASGELPEAARAYRAAGLPWTAADIRVSVPESENAAPLLRAALAAWPHEEESIGFYDPKLSRAYEDGTVEKLLPNYRESLWLAHEAAMRPKLDFARDLDMGMFMDDREFGGMRALVRMLSARAALRAARGDDLGALVDLDDGRKLAELLGTEPSIGSAMSSFATERLTLDGAQDCLIRVRTNPDRLALYRRWLTRESARPDLHRALRGDLYGIVANARNSDRMGVGRGLLPVNDMLPFIDGPQILGGRENPWPTMRHSGLPENTRSRAYMARCLQLWTQLAAETHGLTDDMDRIGRHADAIQTQFAQAKGLTYASISMTFPVYGSLGKTTSHVRARRAVTLGFADALAFRTRTGHWPTSSAIHDPFGKGTLAVHFDGVRFRIWSVGANGKSEGDLLKRVAKEGSRPDDIVAVYPPYPPRPRLKPPAHVAAVRED